MENETDEQSIYHILLLYCDDKERDKFYSQEFAHVYEHEVGGEIILASGIELSDSVSRKNHKSYEVLFRRQENHYTGDKKLFFFKEKYSAISLIVSVPSVDYLDQMINLQEVKAEKKQKVNQASVSFTTQDYDEWRLGTFNQELIKQSKIEGIYDRNFVVRKYEGSQERKYNYLDGYVRGKISSAIAFFEFVDKRGIKMDSLNISFFNNE